MRRIRVVSRALSRPFGGGMTLILLFRGGHPPKSPFLRGTPKGCRPLDTRNVKPRANGYDGGSERTQVAEGAALLRLPWRVSLRGLHC